MQKQTLLICVGTRIIDRRQLFKGKKYNIETIGGGQLLIEFLGADMMFDDFYLLRHGGGWEIWDKEEADCLMRCVCLSALGKTMEEIGGGQLAKEKIRRQLWIDGGQLGEDFYRFSGLLFDVMSPAGYPA